jgi:UDP-N-acetylglucosamine diphosphorylase/glucosamine-1-phosphate N-acetyltransferase
MYMPTILMTKIKKTIMNLILFDDQNRDNLLPLTFTKPVAELRVGILSIREKWEKQLGLKGSFLTQDYLQTKYTTSIAETNLLINGALLPNPPLVDAIQQLKIGQSLKKGNTLLAVKTASGNFNMNDDDLINKAAEYPGEAVLIDYPWKIFSLNGQEIETDYTLLTSGRKSAPLSETVSVLHRENVFVEEGFSGEYFTLNAATGPVYLGKNSEIMEGAVIRGPFALGEQSTVKLAAKIYGPTTLGPHCKAGGEINNAVLQGYSNKGHDGFLGNAVLGEWCNLGADTNNSNLKNNYTEVKVWNYPSNRFIRTGLQFCGLIMGDHSKTGINTMLNTGTVVGVSANIFGSGFPRNFIPSFSWGGVAGLDDYRLEKAFETMSEVMRRRDIELKETDMNIFRHIYNETAKYRRWNS